VEAQNTVVPALARLNDATQVLTLDGATVKPSKLEASASGGLAEGTLIYAKHVVAYYSVSLEAGYLCTESVVAWDFIIAKFLTLDQLSKIEDWTNLP